MAKETLKIVIIGHVDHGKSTLTGRLLLDTHSLPKEKIQEIKKISKELGRDTQLAYLTDQLKEERERNITIDTTQIFFKTRKRNYVIIDAPGHVEFIKNMMSGASQAQAAILIVDVHNGIREQTKRHVSIMTLLGIKHIIVVFNKMDLLKFKEEKFKQVKDELLKFLEKAQIKPLQLIPVSAKEGDNITQKSKHMKWYKGPTLLQILDSFRLESNTAEKPLRFPIQDVYEINGQKIIVGKITSGIIREKQEIFCLPLSQRAKIKSIVVYGKNIKEARANENIGLILNKPLPLKRGDIISDNTHQPTLTTTFNGTLFWMCDEPLQLHTTITLRCATQEVSCTIEKIEKRIDSATLKTIQENASELKINEIGIVTFKTDHPIVIEKFDFIEELGRFVVEHKYNLQGAGIIV